MLTQKKNKSNLVNQNDKDVWHNNLSFFFGVLRLIKDHVDIDLYRTLHFGLNLHFILKDDAKIMLPIITVYPRANAQPRCLKLQLCGPPTSMFIYNFFVTAFKVKIN